MHIIVADPNQKTLWALKTLLDEEPGMEVVGEASNAKQLQEAVEIGGTDLVLLDRRLPGAEIQSLIRKLHALEPSPIVVVMSSDNDDGRYALKMGADAFLSKGERADWTLRVLRQYAESAPVNSEEGGR